MKSLSRIVALCAILLATAGAASASVIARIDISSQRMTVTVDGVVMYNWPVSTARAGYVTPVGSYSAQWLAAMWHSTKYDNAPMPHAVFFHGGYAIHGTYSIGSLGRPASHGCIRLSPGNAATFFSLISAHRGDSRIIVSY